MHSVSRESPPVTAPARSSCSRSRARRYRGRIGGGAVWPVLVSMSVTVLASAWPAHAAACALVKVEAARRFDRRHRRRGRADRGLRVADGCQVLRGWQPPRSTSGAVTAAKAAILIVIMEVSSFGEISRERSRLGERSAVSRPLSAIFLPAPGRRSGPPSAAITPSAALTRSGLALRCRAARMNAAAPLQLEASGRRAPR